MHKPFNAEGHEMSQIAATPAAPSFHWRCPHTWRRSAYNTMWCLIGCSIGDFGAILWFQTYSPDSPLMLVMVVAVVCGILTSIVLETIILLRSMALATAFRTAVGMSLVSMVAMEIAMNTTDFALAGGARLYLWTIPPALLAGFLTPWPYNYWRLKKYGEACH